MAGQSSSTLMKMKLATSSLMLVVLFLLPSAPASSAFSEESLKDLSRLPHLQRHWLQRLDQVNSKRNRVTTSPPSVSASTTTDATEESLEVVEDERVTTTSPTRDADAGMRGDGGGGVITSILTISEAKEKLKARRIKNRKKLTVLKEEQPHQYKRTDEIHSPGSTEEDTVEVKKHIQRMSSATCGIPAVRLIYVHEQHEPAPNVRYLPSCTWLHRCSDDIGCCLDSSKTCSASNIESVSLPFFVLTMIGLETRRTVTKLTFENHTACECVGRNSDVMPRTEPVLTGRPLDDLSWARSYLSDGQANRENGHQSSRSDGRSTKRKNHGVHHALGRLAAAYSPLSQQQSVDLHPTKNSKCRCPSGYAPSGGKKRPCVCHCRNRQSEGIHRQHHRCGRLKKGLEVFPQRDRGCIVEKKCIKPSCDYGSYITLYGRCPRRDEQNQSWLRFLS